MDGGVAFVHLAAFDSEEAKATMLGLPEFAAFQTALKGSGVVSPPKSEPMSLVGAGHEFFG